MSCGRCCFRFALAFSFVAVKFPKMANRPNKQPKETSVYRKFVRFMKDSKMKTFSVYAGLVQGPINILLLLFLFRIAFTIRAVTSLKMVQHSLRVHPACGRHLGRASYAHALSSVEGVLGHFL